MNHITTVNEGGGDLLAEIARTTQSPALRIMLDEHLFEKAKAMAHYMAGAKGFIPKHLEGNTHACFAVVVRAITWKMDPYAVAAGTYQTPGGTVGYEGKLIQAVVENSGKLDPAYGGLKPEYFGDWSKVQARFTMKTSAKGNQYPAQGWTPADEEGLGVIVTGKLRGEADPRELRFLLKQAHPRNSTLWATDPETQLWYAAVRRFANARMPGLLLGLPDEGQPEYGQMIDVTPPTAEPRPSRASVRTKAAERQQQAPVVEPEPEPDPQPDPEPDPQEGAAADDAADDDAADGDGEEPTVYEIVDEAGEIRQYTGPGEAVSEYLGRLKRIAKPGAVAIVRGFMETNAATVGAILDGDLVEDGRNIIMEAQTAAIAAAQPAQQSRDDEPPPPNSADDYGSGGGQQQAGQQAPPQQQAADDWLVPYPANAKNSTGMVSYMTALKAKLATCQHKGHVAQFNRANRKNMVEAATKFRLAQLHELVTEVDAKLHG